LQQFHLLVSGGIIVSDTTKKDGDPFQPTGARRGEIREETLQLATPCPYSLRQSTREAGFLTSAPVVSRHNFFRNLFPGLALALG